MKGWDSLAQAEPTHGCACTNVRPLKKAWHPLAFHCHRSHISHWMTALRILCAAPCCDVNAIREAQRNTLDTWRSYLHRESPTYLLMPLNLANRRRLLCVCDGFRKVDGCCERFIPDPIRFGVLQMETEKCISEPRSSGERVKRKHHLRNEEDSLAPGSDSALTRRQKRGRGGKKAYLAMLDMHRVAWILRETRMDSTSVASRSA